MPSLSPTMSEGTIVKWYKCEGDMLSAGDLLCDIQTDKAVLGFEYDDEGVLAKIIKGDNTKGLPVGSLIALVAEGDTDWRSVNVPQEQTNPFPSPTNTPILQSNKSPGIPLHINDRLLGPVAKSLLHQYHLQPSLLQHTGPHGILTKSDVWKFIESNKLTPTTTQQIKTQPTTQQLKTQPATHPIKTQPTIQQIKTTTQTPQIVQKSTPQPTTTSSTKQAVKKTKMTAAERSEVSYVDIPLSEPHKNTLKLFSSTKNDIAHSYISMSVSVDSVLSLCQQYKMEGMHVDWLGVVLKATSSALQQFPELNSCFVDGVLKENDRVNVSLNLGELSSYLTILDAPNAQLNHISKLIQDFKTQGLTDSFDPAHSSVVVSHIEDACVTGYLPIIKPPSVCSLSVSALQSVFSHQPAQKNLIDISICVDNRFVDDTLGSQFLQHIKNTLEKPALMSNNSSSIDLSNLFAK